MCFSSKPALVHFLTTAKTNGTNEPHNWFDLQSVDMMCSSHYISLFSVVTLYNIFLTNCDFHNQCGLQEIVG